MVMFVFQNDGNPEEILVDVQGYTIHEYTTPHKPETSVCVEPQTPDVPAVDFSKVPLLSGTPRAGDKIAYKILEMSADYTPEISNYKVSFDVGHFQVKRFLLNY